MIAFSSGGFTPDKKKGSSVVFRVVVRPQSIVHDMIDSEAVVMDIEAGVYFSFNEAATKIWLRIVNADASETSIYTFAGPQNIHFIDFLLENKIILRELAPEGWKDEAVNLTQVSESAKWQTYSDMKELLLLDPVHDIALNEDGWPEKRGE